tara:strand:+ start:1283 stop:2440 length:1158 start_codon:yes stop_codon:yes gene_type:complete
MKNSNLIQEEIDRARQLWGYDTSKTIFEQFTGNTGVTGNPLMGITMNTCTGGTVPPDGNSYGMQYAVTINGNNPTQSDIGKTVIANSSYLGNVHGTVTGVFPAGIQQGHSTPHAFGVQPCPTTNTGTSQSWWCDPTGAYVNANGGNCVQSPNQPQSYFTGPYPSEADCNANCATTGGPTPTGTTTGSTNCMKVTLINTCPQNSSYSTYYGTPGVPSPGGTWNMNWGQGPSFGCATIDGQAPTQMSVGTFIEGGTGVPGEQWEVYSVEPATNTNLSDLNTTTCGTTPVTGGPTPTGTTNTGTTTGTTGGQFPGNYNPQVWFTTFINNAQSKPWYATRKCQFFQNRINKWNTQLQRGVGPKQQNMLQNKIGQTKGEAVGEGCNFPGL